MKCKKGFDVCAHKSAAGYYLGTWDEEGPRCRLTTAYAPTIEEAMTLEIDRECAMENSFCNGGAGCGL